MKAWLFLLTLSLAALTLPACHTASHVVEGAADEGAHAISKTGSAVAHGVRKVERQF